MADEVEGQEPEVQDEERQEDEPQNPEVNDDGDPDPIEALASEMGWAPKDKYTGPPEKWKPADQFIREGREIQRGYASELKGLRSQMDVIAKTSAQIVQDQVERQRAELVERFNAAVEDGNATEAHKISVDLGKLETKVPQAEGPSPEGQQFAEKHSSWFGKDAAATARAVDVTNQMAAKGLSHADQLRAAERVIRAEYPEHFRDQQNGRSAPLVNAPGSRTSAPSNRAKGFSDMPKAAQDIANGMVERGVITKKEDYANYYWKNAEGKR